MSCLKNQFLPPLPYSPGGCHFGTSIRLIQEHWSIKPVFDKLLLAWTLIQQFNMSAIFGYRLFLSSFLLLWVLAVFFSPRVWSADALEVHSSSGSIVRGEVVYSRACSACHGDHGDGIGPAARYLFPPPRNFTKGMFKFRSTPSGEVPTDMDLLRIVDNGIPGSQMPAWKNLLSMQERLDVIAFLKTFSADFMGNAIPPLPIPETLRSTPLSIQNGKYMYMLMECFACHGGRGKGNGVSSKTLLDDWGGKIKPWNLTRWKYKGGNDPQSLYRTLATGLNGTPMPAYVPDGFLINGDAVVDRAKYREAYDEKEIKALQEWLKTQPTGKELAAMPEEQKKILAEERQWFLVHYMGSLIHKTNYLVGFFTDNTEETR